ncbi:MAG: hypothetical protein JWR63_4509 [Conexibacter sp.]|nr:hypothetical protein [Conexibacter sp.]
MSTLYIVQAQPNPPGKDALRPGQATDRQLNDEWIEIQAVNGTRHLAGDEISQLTFTGVCVVTGAEVVISFSEGVLHQGQRLRLHTGRGTNYWDGSTFHMYLGRTWFIWNNRCGDRITIRYQQGVVDTAGYAPGAPEGVLARVAGTDRLEPVRATAYRAYF